MHDHQNVDGFFDAFASIAGKGADALKSHASDLITAAAEIKKAKILQKGELDLQKAQAKADAKIYGMQFGQGGDYPQAYGQQYGSPYGRGAGDLLGGNQGLIIAGAVGLAAVLFFMSQKK